MSKSTHSAVIVSLDTIEKHQDADSLSIARLDNGYTVVIRTSDWINCNKAIFIPPENLVDTLREEFAFMHGKRQWEKIKVKRLRGVISAGLLIPALDSDNVGDDVTERLGIVHDDPEAKFEDKDQAKPPTGQMAHMPKYDIDSFAKLYKYFKPEDEVVAGVKIHGQNSRFVYSSTDAKLYVGARTTWQKEGGICYSAVNKYPGIADFCLANPDFIVFGEVFGQQGREYSYGLPPKTYDFRAFDIKRPDFSCVDYDEFISLCKQYNIPTVVEVYRGPFTSLEFLKQFAEGSDPIWAGTPREGCVVKLVHDRMSYSGDRMIFKIIGSGYKG